jgi:hypothetical protein
MAVRGDVNESGRSISAQHRLHERNSNGRAQYIWEPKRITMNFTENNHVAKESP